MWRFIKWATINLFFSVLRSRRTTCFYNLFIHPKCMHIQENLCDQFDDLIAKSATCKFKRKSGFSSVFILVVAVVAILVQNQCESSLTSNRGKTLIEHICQPRQNTKLVNKMNHQIAWLRLPVFFWIKLNRDMSEVIIA